MELRAEDWASFVNQPFVTLVVQIDKVLFPVRGQGRSVDGVAMVLGCDVAFASRQVERRDVVGTVTIFELDGSGSGGEGEKLMAETDAHDGDGG